MKNYYFVFIGLMVFGLLQSSCKDDDPGSDACDNLSATYDGAVKGIINSSCSYDGCHNSTNPNVPDFSSFSGLESSLNADKFGMRVLVDKNMPPADFVPEGNPTELTDAQLEILQCWADAGYPES